jgi:hypothetical protein
MHEREARVIIYLESLISLVSQERSHPTKREVLPRRSNDRLRKTREEGQVGSRDKPSKGIREAE